MIKTVIDQILETGEIDRKHRHYGVRCASNSPVGGEVADSYEWDDGEQTDELIDGACTVDIFNFDSAEQVLEYCDSAYGHLGSPMLVCGDYGRHGNDDHELIISNAIRIA